MAELIFPTIDETVIDNMVTYLREGYRLKLIDGKNSNEWFFSSICQVRMLQCDPEFKCPYDKNTVPICARCNWSKLSFVSAKKKIQEKLTSTRWVESKVPNIKSSDRTLELKSAHMGTIIIFQGSMSPTDAGLTNFFVYPLNLKPIIPRDWQRNLRPDKRPSIGELVGRLGKGK